MRCRHPSLFDSDQISFENIGKEVLDSIKSEILLDIEKISSNHGFAKYEFIKNIFIEWKTQLWTPENGFLTPTMKAKRQVFLEKYAEVIKVLY